MKKEEEPVVIEKGGPDDVLDDLFSMNEEDLSLHREVFSEHGTTRPYTREEIEEFLNMSEE